jgi:hypothetical protein
LEPTKHPKGAFAIWKWRDQEIENPSLLRKQLLEMYSRGFSGVLVSFGPARYEFLDRRVIRAVAQAGQWAKKRHLAFWFQADPRQASRAFISRTGERTENLLVARSPKDGLNPNKPNIVRVVDHRFELRYEIPRVHSSRIREVSVHFEPSGLERAFIFQMEKGVIQKDTIQDITPACQFFTNLAQGYAEVFGEIRIPEGGEWWSIAFPKFYTNLYDFAGRQSNDLLLPFIEDLFDACTQLDGITWSDGEVGYIADLGRFPVSLSLYNSFKIEYGYDLRDVLYGLILPLDDGSHARIRCDYYNLLMSTVFGAQRDFYQMIHSFFNGLAVGIHHTWHYDTQRTNELVRGSIDPWQGLEQVSSTFIDVAETKMRIDQSNGILSTLIITKSLGIYSDTQNAYINLTEANLTKKELVYWVDMISLYSVQYLATFDNEIEREDKQQTKNDEKTANTVDFEKLNRRIHDIRKITRFKFPEANVALIYPTETIAAIGTKGAEKIIQSISSLVSKLTLEGIQLDVISSAFLKKGRISDNKFHIQTRSYDWIIFPYPEVLHPEVLEIILKLDKCSFPVFLGGCKPRITSTGKPIHHDLPVSFDPKDKDLSSLLGEGIKPVFVGPKNGLATQIRQKNETLYLFCPKEFGSQVSGKAQCGDITFTVPKSRGLVIFKVTTKGKVDQVL